MAQMTRPTQGVQIIEEALGAPPISTANFSAIGIAGTAPDAKIDGKFANKAKDGIAYNQPFYITKRSDAADLGSSGTLPLALDSIFAQGSVGVVVVIVDPGRNIVDFTMKPTYKAAASESAFKTAVDSITPVADRSKFYASVYQETSPTKTYLAFINLPADAVPRLKNLKDGDKIDYVTNAAGTKTIPVATGEFDAAKNRIEVDDGIFTNRQTDFTDGTAYDITLKAVTAADITSQSRTAAAGSSSDLTGVWALKKSQSEHGVTPRIIATPGIDNGTPSGSDQNTLGGELEKLAKDQRAIAIIDLPNERSEATAAAAKYGGDRTVLVSPAARMAKPGTEETIEFAMSGFVAGKIAVNDSEQGFWTPLATSHLQACSA